MKQMKGEQEQEPAKTRLYVGCAGWSLPKAFAEDFSDEGSHLERYATRFSGVEINSSFYRPHQIKTYVKWAASEPNSFRFAVKVPKSITHQKRLQNTDELLDRFLEEVAGLGGKLGPLLVQLPPSLIFNPDIAARFFSTLREGCVGQVVCEPRYPTWFEAEANDLLLEYQIAQVVADPAPVPEARKNGGWEGLAYYRLHGSPTIYRSAYTAEFLVRLAARIEQDIIRSVPTWCIFYGCAMNTKNRKRLKLVSEFLESLQLKIAEMYILCALTAHSTSSRY